MAPESNNPYWSPFVHQLTPYTPGEQPKFLGGNERLIKLNTNENPYSPSPSVLSALKAGVDDGLRLYPDPNSTQLKQSLGEYYSVGVDQVFVGNGSDEVLAHLFCALFKGTQPILFPEVTYSFYPVYSRLYGVEYHVVQMRADLSIDLAAFQRPNGGIIFANPNAPTGRLLNLSDIASLAELQATTSPDAVLVVDEAYIDFGGVSATSLVSRFPNLLVVQTFSKSRSLAGIRLGFAIGQAHLIEAMNRVKNSFNSYPIDRLAELAGIAALKDESYFQETRKKIIDTREQFVKSLEERGCLVIPSKANFVLAKLPAIEGLAAKGLAANSAEVWSERFRERNIIIRHFKQAPVEKFLRVTVGTDDQIKRFLDVMDSFLVA